MLHALARRLADWSQTRRDIALLRHLDNHLLADMGIERRQIARLVRGRIEPAGRPAEQPAPGFLRLGRGASPSMRSGSEAIAAE